MRFKNMSGRLVGLDSLRAALMLVGVLIHASSIMSPVGEWKFNSANELDYFFYGVIYSTHFFRMETFFIISGFFSYLIIQRKGLSYFLNNRVKRVLIPFLASVITISPLIYYFEINFRANYILSISSILNHFWFLLTLLILSIVSISLKTTSLFGTICVCFLNVFLKNKHVFLLFLILMGFLNNASYGVVSFLLDGENINFKLIYKYFVYNTIYYGCFYFLGAYLYFFKEKVTLFTYSCKTVFFCLFLFVCAFFCIQMDVLNLGNKIAYFIYLSLLCVPAFVVSTSIFNFFYNFNFGDNRFVLYLIDSSLVVYIFHVPVLLFLSKLIEHFYLNAYFYFFSICISTYVFSFIIYELIKRTRYLKILYGLK